MLIQEFADKIKLNIEQYNILLSLLDYYDTEHCTTLAFKLRSFYPTDQLIVK